MVAVQDVDARADESVCSNDGCSRRYRIGWGEMCEDCALISQDHEAGLHAVLVLECRNCW